MPRAPIRSFIFIFFFYILVAIECVLCLPLIFLPRRAYMVLVVSAFVNSVYFLERTILGLNYEIRGLEHLPQTGSYIVAAKHQSAYETMKLHRMFDDPAIILKKELLSIPLWGNYLKKADVIAIDRSTPDAAITSIQEGAKRMMAQGRPIIIFPQGTRVGVDQTTKEKPYKVGVARVQEATNLPIIPMAMNAGLYWPRNGWLKSSGTVIFEFLPPIEPGMERSKLLQKLEQDIEPRTEALAAEGRSKAQNAKKANASLLPSLLLVAAILLGFFAYSWYWTKIADAVRTEYPIALRDMTGSDLEFSAPQVTGYPGKIKIDVPQETIESPRGRVTLSNFHAEGWPLPYLPIKVTAGPIEVENFRWSEPLIFDSFEAEFSLNEPSLNVKNARLVLGDFNAQISGTADLSQEPIPLLEMDLELTNHFNLIQVLADKKIIEKQSALFVSAGMAALADKDGVVKVPVLQRGQTLYAGPLPIITLPIARMIAAPTSAGDPQETPDLQAPSP